MKDNEFTIAGLVMPILLVIPAMIFGIPAAVMILMGSLATETGWATDISYTASILLVILTMLTGSLLNAGGRDFG